MSNTHTAHRTISSIRSDQHRCPFHVFQTCRSNRVIGRCSDTKCGSLDTIRAIQMLVFVGGMIRLVHSYCGKRISKACVRLKVHAVHVSAQRFDSKLHACRSSLGETIRTLPVDLCHGSPLTANLQPATGLSYSRHTRHNPQQEQVLHDRRKSRSPTGYPSTSNCRWSAQPTTSCHRRRAQTRILVVRAVEELADCRHALHSDRECDASVLRGRQLRG